MNAERDFINWLEGFMYGKISLNSRDIAIVYKKISVAKAQPTDADNIVDKYKDTHDD
jgi:hypothetical protein